MKLPPVLISLLLVLFTLSARLDAAGASPPTHSTLPVRATIVALPPRPAEGQWFHDCNKDGNGVVLGGTDNGNNVICGRIYFGTELATVNEVERESQSPLDGPRVNSALSGTRFEPSSSSTERAYAEVFASGKRANVQAHAHHEFPQTQPDWRCPDNEILLTWYWSADTPGYLCGSVWSGNPPPTGPSGTIAFTHWETKLPCALTVPNGPTGETWTYYFSALSSPCAEDTTEGIEFKTVPSATRIFLSGNERCEKDEDEFWIELRTTQKSVTLPALQLDEYLTYEPGAIVRPGVMLVAYRKVGNEPVTRHLKCVRITTSSAPPTPPSAVGQTQGQASNVPVRATLTFLPPDPIPSGYFSCKEKHDGVLVGLSPAGFHCARISFGQDKATLGPVEKHIDYSYDGPMVNAAVEGIASSTSDERGYVTVNVGDTRANVRREQIHVSPDMATYRCPGNELMLMLSLGTRDFLCGSVWSGNPVADDGAGKVIFRHWQTSTPCTLDVPHGPTGERWTYYFEAPASPCLPGTAKSIELEGVPSATRILLSGHRHCLKLPPPDDDAFWAELKTTQKSVSFSEFLLDDLFRFTPGDIVQPGLQLVASHRKGSDPVYRKLQCVEITTSSAPPGR